MKVRIGLNASEPIAEDTDPFRISAQVTRQICERAEPGQVLVSDVVRQLVAGKGFTFEPVRVKVLKGFDEPVVLYKVSDSRTSLSRPRTAPRSVPSTPVTRLTPKSPNRR